jgi:hypothetical protein
VSVPRVLPGEELTMSTIEIRATVQSVTEVGVSLEPEPDAEKDMAIEPVRNDGCVWISFAPDENGEKARAFGAIMLVKGAVKITIEPAGTP